MKRKDYISWDEYFMGVAILASKRSKDPNTQVGACIVDNNNIILSTGYNGFPFGCSDDDYPWCRDGEDTLQFSSTTPTKLFTLTKKKCVVTHIPFSLNLLCAPA